jgi:hypothetical protein
MVPPLNPNYFRAFNPGKLFKNNKKGCVQGDKQKSRRPTLYSVAAAIRTGIFIGERQHFGVNLLQEE